MEKRMRFQHDCELPAEIVQRVVTLSPYSSNYAKYCHYVSRFMTIHKYYEIQQYFRSNSAFLKEKNRHLYTKNYSKIIHPFSRFAICQKMVINAAWLVALILYPYLGSFRANNYFDENKPNSIVLNCVVGITDAILMLDMVCRFNMGYTTEKTREIVLDPRRIVRNYITTYFFFDITPLLCNYMLFLFLHLSNWHEILIYQLHILRCARLKTLLDNFSSLLQYFSFKEPRRICVQIAIVIVLMLHWWTCLLGFVPLIRDTYNISSSSSWSNKLHGERLKIAMSRQVTGDIEAIYTPIHDYCQYMSAVMCHFFGAGVGRFKTNDALEMLLFALMLISGVSVYVYTISRVLQLFGMVNISETKFEQLTTQAGEYMVNKKFPTILKKRIAKYYDYKFGNTFFSEQDILDSLSEHLRMEILLYSCRNLIEKVQIFRGLSKSAVGCILALLKQEIYLTQDVIMSAEESSGTLYFILYGTCGIRLSSGIEVLHVEDGDHFGYEGGTSGKRNFFYTVEALEICEIYTLSRNDIKYCCIHYPEITTKLEQMTKAKAKYFKSLFAESSDDVFTNSILAELRRGHILEHGRRRDPVNIKFTLTI